MPAIIFDGNQAASLLEQHLKKEVALLQSQGKKIVIGAVLFKEDVGSRLYTDLKKQAAGRVGIEYRLAEFSLMDDVKVVQKQIQDWNQDTDITGIIVQKPWRKTWNKLQTTQLDLDKARIEFNKWWQSLVSKIDIKKDVDGLHPRTLEFLRNGHYDYKKVVMPATARAVMAILESASLSLANNNDLSSWLKNKKILVLGRSDIVGLPVFYVLKSMNLDVHILGKKQIQIRKKSNQKFLDADVLISSTGVHHLVDSSELKNNCVLVDVGEPRADIDVENCEDKCDFITPIPGGVGPMTVSYLLQNSTNLKKPH